MNKVKLPSKYQIGDNVSASINNEQFVGIVCEVRFTKQNIIYSIYDESWAHVVTDVLEDKVKGDDEN